ncbi:hypothetical protein QBC34DRAFT_416310 [Podospora aff. communis PSN243]|uniref:NAD(P)-binding protein n=1 Tax=Podospora aff. communis PSN243 TaxID=3040156 RepID=A0AAV9G6C1_9PEZI|nr:hypothetical protein QBC34DRAFT_416310 [Podospora aff. communis PSN243]
MAEIEYSEAVAQNVCARVIVVTGGARGIGGETVTLLHRLGAHVVFGDVLESAGTKLASSLSSSQPAKPSGGSAHFVKTNVCSYADQLALFAEAFRRHGRVDAAVTCAGVLDHPGWFDPSMLTLDAVQEESSAITTALNTNLISAVHFSRLAIAYITASPPLPGDFIPSLTFTASIAGIFWAPSMPCYSTSKHGLVGLSRTLSHNPIPIRSNSICPSATNTQILSDYTRKTWTGHLDLPMQEPADVAKYIVQCVADSTLSGKTVVVARGEACDVDEPLDRCAATWIGEENAREWKLLRSLEPSKPKS